MDVANCKDMNLAPEPFIEYAQHAGDSILGFAGCLASLANKVDKQAVAYMTKEEKATFEQLEADKMKSVDGIKAFVLKEQLRYQLMQQEATVGAAISDLVRNVRPEVHVEEITQLRSNLTELQTRYQHFKSELEENCNKDGRRHTQAYKHISACLGGLTMVAAAVAAACFIIAAVACPAIDAVVIPLGYYAVGVFTAGAWGLAGGTVLAVSLRPDEIDRAMAYMNDLQRNLQMLKESMQSLEAGGAVIAEPKQLKHFIQIAKSLEERSCHIAQICDEVSKSTFCG